MAAAPPRGLLLVNLGSPSAPTPAAVRAFLDEFLADPLVVDANPLGWWLLRKLVILPRRGRAVARLYGSIWTPEGSPLMVHGRRLQQAVAGELGAGWRVALAMRYGEPSLDGGLAELRRAGCRQIVLFPLFPQYSRSTTGSIERAADTALAALRDPPELTVAPPYFEEPAYIACLAASIREAAGEPPPHLVLSFHGLPERFIAAGDPYQEHCERTARALAAELQLPHERWSLSYQSRFGRERWLGPATEELVPRLAAAHPRLAVACPGFAADCLETLEEVAGRLVESCRATAGREPVVVPCLNARPDWARAVAALALRGLS